MKFQKATVTIIKLGNEDILTCSGYTAKTCNWPHSCDPTNNNSQTKASNKSYGWGWPWGGWFFWHW